MKVLRIILILGSLSLVVWGMIDWFSDIPDLVKQAISKIVLGLGGMLAALLARSRKR